MNTSKLLTRTPSSIAIVPPFAGLRRFPQGRGFKQWTGDDSKALMKVSKSFFKRDFPNILSRSTCQPLKAMYHRRWCALSVLFLNFVTSHDETSMTHKVSKTYETHSADFTSIVPSSKQRESVKRVAIPRDNTLLFITPNISAILAPPTDYVRQSPNQNTSKQ